MQLSMSSEIIVIQNEYKNFYSALFRRNKRGKTTNQNQAKNSALDIYSDYFFKKPQISQIKYLIAIIQLK